MGEPREIWQCDHCRTTVWEVGVDGVPVCDGCGETSADFRAVPLDERPEVKPNA